MSKDLIRIRKLIKNYHDGERTLEVLRGLDFSLAPGETVAITGQSGSGKSTLLNLLCLLDMPTEGSIFFEGNDIGKMSSSQVNKLRRHNIGLVFQFHHLLQEFRAWENVAMPALIAGISRSKARTRAMELLDEVGLADRADQLPSKMSGGEQQRVALARALMNDPPVVLADEPTGNLDEATAKTVSDLLWKETKDRGRSLVIVTHEKDIAKRADRVLLLKEGQLHSVD